MQTESVLLQNLCVPCACRCRYCLLSCDVRLAGVPWERGAEFALRFADRIKIERPGLRFRFAFGYCMEHPDIPAALRFLKRIGSPQAEFWQCDGMKMRNEAECASLAEMLASEGVKHLNFTFYGLEEYHDRFAGRKGDHALMLHMLRAAAEAGLETSVGVPLTKESAPMAEELISLLREYGKCKKIRLFIPHEEGRGRSLDKIRFSESDICLLSAEALALLNLEVYRPERDWVSGGFAKEETRRSILISLRADNIEKYETMTPGGIVSEVEALDDKYYAAFPPLPELAARYGDPNGARFFSQRDIFYHYRRAYAQEFGVNVYDVTDETQSGSRRY